MAPSRYGEPGKGTDVLEQMDLPEAKILKWTALRIVMILNEEQAAKRNETVPTATCYKATLQIAIAAIDDLYRRQSIKLHKFVLAHFCLRLLNFLDASFNGFTRWRSSFPRHCLLDCERTELTSSLSSSLSRPLRGANIGCVCYKKTQLGSSKPTTNT